MFSRHADSICLPKGVPLERWDCLQSTKGGKRGESFGGVYDMNPCFCPFDGYCKVTSSGAVDRGEDE